LIDRKMRKAEITRGTSETEVAIKINLDGTGKTSFSTGLPFLEHMLDQVGRHGMIDLDIKAKGDLHIDDHHTIEDIGITLGEAFNKAVGDKKGIRRYGHSYVPLDEALSRVVLDFSGRPGLFMNVKFVKDTVGNMEVGMFEHFFQSFSNHAFVTLHIDNLSGDNTHHQIETIFKAFGRSLRMALELDKRSEGAIPSTKGSL
jgi:imidazoleglycerol-phosphate dehydratase